MSFDYNKFVSGKALLKEQGSEDLSNPTKTEPKKTSNVHSVAEAGVFAPQDDEDEFAHAGGVPHEQLVEQLLALTPNELGEVLKDVAEDYLRTFGQSSRALQGGTVRTLVMVANMLVAAPGGDEDFEGEDLDEYSNVDQDDFTDPRGSGDPHQDMTQAQRGAMNKVNEKKHDFKKLSEDEKTQLKEYINSVKEIRKEIKGLMEKAKVEERGGNVYGKTLSVESKKKLNKEALTPPPPNAIYKKDTIKNKLIQWLQDQGNNVRYTDMINAAYAFSKGMEPGTVKAPRGWYSANTRGAQGTEVGNSWPSGDKMKGNMGQEFGKGHLAKKSPGSGRVFKNPNGSWGSEW